MTRYEEDDEAVCAQCGCPVTSAEELDEHEQRCRNRKRRT